MLELLFRAKWMQRREQVPRRECGLVPCAGKKPLWERLLHRHTGVLLHGQFYCGQRCLETALRGEMSDLRAMTVPAVPPNRIPLGLLMVARGKLTHMEVRAALEAQRRAQHGNIGDWIEKLGFATEQEITSALALQWGCPVASTLERALGRNSEPTLLRTSERNSERGDLRFAIPLAIVEAFQMVPFNYAASTNTLYLAFGARVDHAALYAIEIVLNCRTQPCVASARNVAEQIDGIRQSGRPRELEFASRDLGEMARISSSYIARLSPEDVRLCRVGQFIWLRLKGNSGAMNLLFRLQGNTREGSYRAATKTPPRLVLEDQRLSGKLRQVFEQ